MATFHNKCGEDFSKAKKKNIFDCKILMGMKICNKFNTQHFKWKITQLQVKTPENTWIPYHSVFQFSAQSLLLYLHSSFSPHQAAVQPE